MGAKRAEYQLVGRYYDGKTVVGYQLQSIESNKTGVYTKEALAYLIGRNQVTNCQGAINNDQFILRGVGMSIDDLPVVNADGVVSRTDNIGKVRRGTSAADALNQFIIIGVIKNGKNVIGYRVRNAGGGESNLSRPKILELAKQGRIGNARVQNYNGQVILKGVNVNLKTLPLIDATKQAQPSQQA
jgi:hypothetical protein